MEAHVNCKQLLGNLSDYVDGDLQQGLCAEIERHLADCENCRVVVNTLRKTVEIVHQTCSDDELPQEVHQRLFACLHIPEPKPSDPNV
jgi:anti-sigma factor RsiW